MPAKRARVASTTYVIGLSIETISSQRGAPSTGDAIPSPGWRLEEHLVFFGTDRMLAVRVDRVEDVSGDFRPGGMSREWCDEGADTFPPEPVETVDRDDALAQMESAPQWSVAPAKAAQPAQR